MNPDLDPRARLRHILTNALAASTFEASESESGGMLLLHARRADGKRVHLRFRGVKESSTSAEPEQGSALLLRGVGGTSPFWSIFLPPVFRAPSHTARVRIEAGAARLEIVCEDVEWWEDGI